MVRIEIQKIISYYESIKWHDKVFMRMRIEILKIICYLIESMEHHEKDF